MNLRRKLPYIPNFVAMLSLGFSIILWLGIRVSSVKIHPWVVCQQDLVTVILSAVALGASSKAISTLGLISFGVFVIVLIHEYLVLVG
jgi:uncharacterized membrane protein